MPVSTDDISGYLHYGAYQLLNFELLATHSRIQDNGHQTSPPMERLSYERLRTNGIYYLRKWLN